MIIGAGIAIARELIDDRVDGTDELGRKLFLTSLAEIPLVRHLDPEAAVCSLDEPEFAAGAWICSMSNCTAVFDT